MDRLGTKTNGLSSLLLSSEDDDDNDNDNDTTIATAAMIPASQNLI